MRNGVIDWMAIVAVLISAIVGAILEKETDGKVTQIIMYSDTNNSMCYKEKKYPEIYLGN